MPKQIKANGLREVELVIAEAAITDIIRYYTRESGVRNLERELAKIARKVVKDTVARPGQAKGSTPKTHQKWQEPGQVSGGAAL